MKIEKTHTFWIKAALMIAVILFFIIAIIGHFYGAQHVDQGSFDFLKVKLADATIGHAVLLVFLCYGFFGK
jgi:hypothetical protein